MNARKIVCAIVHEPSQAITLETAALDFIEQEVGRHDWRNNWTQMRRNQDMVLHAKNWLVHYHIDLDPAALVEFIDNFVKQETGRWR